MDYNNFKKELEKYAEWDMHAGDLWNESSLKFGDEEDIIYFPVDDRVNSPSHYTAGKQEAIDIIEEAIASAPDNSLALLQGQVLKYMLRIWLKDNPVEDAKKAKWYLQRLIDKMS